MSSIHPQGWVPIETLIHAGLVRGKSAVAFTPKGGCPLKQIEGLPQCSHEEKVAFTPKGGCPLKPFMNGELQGYALQR